MIKKAALALLVLVFAMPAFADFGDVERDLRVRLGRPIYIPFLGIARFAAWVAHPHGVYDFQLTTWESRRARTIDGAEIEQLLVRGLAPGFQPVVRVRARGEWTFIYVRPLGDRFEMMVLTHDHADTVLVRADIDGQQLALAIKDHKMHKLR